MRQTTLLLCLLLCAILCASAICAEKEKPPVATVKGPGFHFTVALTRSVYLSGEPVFAKCSVNNDSRKPQKLVEAMTEYDVVTWNVLRVSDRENMYHPGLHPMVSLAGPPAGLFWEFRPKETKFIYVDACSHTDNGWLQPGEYVVAFTYSAPKAAQADWTGKLTTDEIPFSVVAADSENARVFGAIINSRPYTEDKDELRRRATDLAALAKEKRSGRFAIALRYYAAMALEQVDHEAFMDELKTFVTGYRDTPYYGPLSCQLLGSRYLNDKNWDEARKACSLMPEGYLRRTYLRACDTFEARARDSNK